MSFVMHAMSGLTWSDADQVRPALSLDTAIESPSISPITQPNASDHERDRSKSGIGATDVNAERPLKKQRIGYSCDVCNNGIIYTLKKTFKVHQKHPDHRKRLNLPITRNQCNACGKSFLREDARLRHIREIHQHRKRKAPRISRSSGVSAAVCEKDDVSQPLRSRMDTSMNGVQSEFVAASTQFDELEVKMHGIREDDALEACLSACAHVYLSDMDDTNKARSYAIEDETCQPSYQTHPSDTTEPVEPSTAPEKALLAASGDHLWLSTDESAPPRSGGNLDPKPARIECIHVIGSGQTTIERAFSLDNNDRTQTFGHADSLVKARSTPLESPIVGARPGYIQPYPRASLIAAGATVRPTSIKKSDCCSLCHISFDNDPASMLAHLGEHLTELEAKHFCLECDVEFTHKADLQAHLNSARIDHRCGFKFDHDDPCEGHHQVGEFDDLVVNYDRSALSRKVLKWETMQLSYFRSCVGTISPIAFVPSESDRWSLNGLKKRNAASVVSTSSELTTRSTPDTAGYQSKGRIPYGRERRLPRFHVFIAANA